ncbi:MAG: hypothetical protein FK730_08015 [Asgard group archaeon]|nr:hypothetical protein [Asgard group archaeon]
MVLPSDYINHEKRISKESLEAIEFQYDRLALDPTDIKVFLNRFLKVSQSPTLPPDEYEIIYLAAKVAYMLSKYDYFDSEYFQQNYKQNNGAKIWYALAFAAKGKTEEATEILEAILDEIDDKSDALQYIECLGLLAQIYFVRGSKYKNKLDDIIEKIEIFQETYQKDLSNFDSMFLPAYLIINRINLQQSAPDKILKETTNLYKIAKKLNNEYFTIQFQLDLAFANILAHNIPESKQILDEIFQVLENLKYKALEAKAIRILGQHYEKNEQYDLAEKNFLIAKKSYETLEDQIGIASCVTMLANLAEKQEESSKAEQYYNEAYTISEFMSDNYGMSVALTSLARVIARKGSYTEALEKYTKSLALAKENNFDYLLPTTLDGLAYVNFMVGDIQSAAENKASAIEFKEKLAYDDNDILVDKIRLGQLYAIIGELDSAFNEFEIALNICTKLKIKDDLYFDILNWLFEISTATGKLPLAESYMGRADLFASIHDNQEENAQALISRIRFLIQKQDFETAEKSLEVVFQQAQDFPSPLTMALALIEKASILVYGLIEKDDPEILEMILQTMDDMLFISLDLEFLPLTMYTKKVLGKVLAYKKDFDEGIEELTEAYELAVELGMKKFEDTIKIDLQLLEEMKEEINSIDEEKIAKQNELYLKDAVEYLRQTFWLVSASEHQRE